MDVETAMLDFRECSKSPDDICCDQNLSRKLKNGILPGGKNDVRELQAAEEEIWVEDRMA